MGTVPNTQAYGRSFFGFHPSKRSREQGYFRFLWRSGCVNFHKVRPNWFSQEIQFWLPPDVWLQIPPPPLLDSVFGNSYEHEAVVRYCKHGGATVSQRSNQLWPNLECFIVQGLSRWVAPKNGLSLSCDHTARSYSYEGRTPELTASRFSSTFPQKNKQNTFQNFLVFCFLKVPPTHNFTSKTGGGDGCILPSLIFEHGYLDCPRRSPAMRARSAGESVNEILTWLDLCWWK